MSLTLRHEAPADRRAAETLVREAFCKIRELFAIMLLVMAESDL